ncbi:MAG: ABC transporter ATP-binding protein [Armatimonadota bacterium]|nr:ABC transporter ATP-binding protein [Armatimonadota bacterium]
MAHVEIVNVTKRLGTTLAVQDFSLTVREGSFTTLLGPSGCGKTTLLRMVAGFYRPDRGEIRIGGRTVNDVPPHQRATAMVFQEYALFPHMTVAENVAYGLRKRRVPPERVHKKVAEVLALVDLQGLDDKFPHQLSGGQQQRVALARALAVEPEVLLLDEPLSNLDAKLRVRVRAEIRALQRKIGKTTLYVTHDQEEALAISDTVAVMHRGHLIQVGDPMEVYYKPRTAFVADFVGIANFVRGRACGDAVEADGVRVQVPRSRLPSSAQVTLVFRPEAARLWATPPAAPNVFPAAIVGRVFQGPVARYWVQVEAWVWTVDVHDPHMGLLDGGIYVEIPPNRVHVLAE